MDFGYIEYELNEIRANITAVADIHTWDLRCQFPFHCGRIE